MPSIESMTEYLAFELKVKKNEKLYEFRGYFIDYLRFRELATKLNGERELSGAEYYDMASEIIRRVGWES